MRPLGDLELLDRALWTLAARPGPACAAGAPPAAALALVYLSWIHLTGSSAPEWARTHPGRVLACLAPLAAAAIVARYLGHHLVAVSYFGDDVERALDPPPGLAAAWRRTRGRLVRVLATGAVRGAAQAAALAAFLVPALSVGPRLFLTLPLGLFERKFGPRALAGSWRRIDDAGLSPYRLASWLLAAGAAVAGSLFLAVPLVLHLLDTVLGLDLVLALHLVEADVPFALHAVAALAFVVVDPLLPVVSVLLYLDLRVRREGLDLRLALEDLRSPAKGETVHAS